jgi:ABC-type lipoprotein export system ATPase subunit/predicted  nucleic acid-binding Zn-ribbon protein
VLIERIQVEEGFLDGLDLTFAPGLNVLIGPRGSGKTSVLELLRFCFGVEPLLKKVAVEARQHALSVLGPSGRVTVTARIGGERVQVSRAAGDEMPRDQVAERPVILSQGEIESVGVDAEGRLRIIDGFRARRDGVAQDSLVRGIRSLTVQLQDLGREIARYQSQADALKNAATELREAEAAEAALTKDLAAVRSDQERLTRIGAELASISVRVAVFERVRDSVDRWRDELVAATQVRPNVEQWPEAAGGADPLAAVRTHVGRAFTSAQTGALELSAAIEELNQLRDMERAREVGLSDEARDLRRKLEAIQEGAGGASRRVAELRERVGQLSAMSELIVEREAHIAQLQLQRLGLLDELDAARDARFAERRAVAERLNRELGPRIEVKVTQDASTAEYASAIASTLRGSGLHYSNLAPQLADRLAPRELVEALEAGNVELIASVGGITPERANRLIEHIREVGCEDILTAVTEDSAEFSLLDGKEYKATEDLSTGQRCTVVLPILLAHHDRVLVVDEPEAHLDNAFVVSTVIRALRARHEVSGAQFLFATHNANIPVLGEADEVVLLGSDGSRGFVRHEGPLDAAAIVDAVTTVMEGGRDAFEQRAAFYHAHKT